jgi:hypothetical protein
VVVAIGDVVDVTGCPHKSWRGRPRRREAAQGRRPTPR